MDWTWRAFVLGWYPHAVRLSHTASAATFCGVVGSRRSTALRYTKGSTAGAMRTRGGQSADSELLLRMPLCDAHPPGGDSQSPAADPARKASDATFTAVRSRSAAREGVLETHRLLGQRSRAAFLATRGDYVSRCGRARSGCARAPSRPPSPRSASTLCSCTATGRVRV